MRKVLEVVRALAPDLEIEGEMDGAVALNEAIRNNLFPDSRLSGEANLLIMPTLDSANIAFNLVKQLANGTSGPIGPQVKFAFAGRFKRKNPVVQAKFSGQSQCRLAVDPRRLVLQTKREKLQVIDDVA